MTDPLLVAERLPKLAERAMRYAVVRHAFGGDRRRVSQRAIVDDALLAFERLVQREARDGIRPALLFAERDRIVRELRAFVAGRLAYRLFALRKRDVAKAGRAAAPFDAVVRGRDGKHYAVAFCRLAPGSSRLEAMQAARAGAGRSGVQGIVVYDFTSGTARTLRCERTLKNTAA